MSERFFITGTDTGIGKTYFSCQWLQALKQQGIKTVVVKPLASGCIHSEAGLRNEDALLLQEAASVKLPYHIINPVAFEAPIAPHIAAHLAGQAVNATGLAQACHAALSENADLYLFEGAGGWQVPLNNTETWQDFVKAINAKVILVVGMRLGCLNHALLTVESIKASGCVLAGWVANCLDENMPYLQENIACLKAKIDAPQLFAERGLACGISMNFS